MIASDRAALGLRDRLNPVFVREVQQAFNGKSFLLILALALAAVGTIAAILGLEDPSTQGLGAQGLQLVTMTLAPIAVLVVPTQAFLSMSREMRAGTAELLLLTSLSPGTIVRGKLLAAISQFGLWLSLFAPLLALCYLLRGISVVDVVLGIALTTLFCAAASSFAIALGSLARSGPAAGIVTALAALGLAMATLQTMAFFAWALFAMGMWGGSSAFVEVYGTVCVVLALVVSLGAVVAQSQLQHTVENRSTPFRVFFLTACATGLVWTWAVSTPGLLDGALDRVSTCCFMAGLVFFVFAATEEPELSPRVRARVPRSPTIAFLALPFLPGAGRGLLFAVLATALVGIATIFGQAKDGWPVSRDHLTWLAWAHYAVLYASIAFLLRRLLRRIRRPALAARLATAAFFLFVGILLPTLLQVAFRSTSGSAGREWTLLQVLNPYWTTGTFARRPTGASLALPLLLLIDLVLLLLCLPSVLRSVGEVFAASRANRRRAA